MSPTTQQALVRHAAPVLLFKKPAALFTLPRGERDIAALGGLLAQQGLCVRRMRRQRDRVLLLVYRPQHLAQALADPLAARLLCECGYPQNTPLVQVLRFLHRRLAAFQEFPHEIGLFLGYPPKDVAGFIRHRGSGYKLCGLWKVYDDVERAKTLFCEYERCSQHLQQHLNSGGDLTDLVCITGGPSGAVVQYPKTLEVVNG